MQVREFILQNGFYGRIMINGKWLSDLLMNEDNLNNNFMSSNIMDSKIVSSKDSMPVVMASTDNYMSNGKLLYLD